MSHPTFDVDLSTFGKVRPLTADDLRRYSAADLDPHTIQIGQILCKDFQFSSQGQRELASAFDALPAGINQPDFEVGYGNHHVIHSVLKSDAGFQLAAVAGALAEYFDAKVVVEFFLQLANRSGMPVAWRPLEHQWRRMVEVLYGVLAASPFGTVLTNVEDACLTGNDISSELDVQRMLDALLYLNSVKKEPRKKLHAGADAIWLAAVSRWLFGQKTTIVSDTGTLLYTSQSAHGEEDADVVIVVVPPATQDRFRHLSLSEMPLASNSILGGRVAFEHLFQTCFHQAFTNLPSDLLAAFIYTASNIVKQRLIEEKPDWAFEILSQSNASGEQSVGLVDTLTAWFPELRRLSPRFRKYAKLSDDETKATFDSTYREIRRTCTCEHCIDTSQQDADHPNPEKCSVVVAESIVRISFVLSRMIVTPRLLPKRHGIVSFVRRYRSESTPRQRQALRESQNPSEYFQTRIVHTFNSSVDTIKSAALIFANSTSPDIEAEESLMGVTHCGLTIFSTGAKDMVAIDTAQVKAQDKKWKSAIQVSPGWMCLSGHEARLEVYVNVPGGLAFGELSTIRRADGELAKVRQMLRWSGRKMCTTIVYADTECETQASRDGWSGLKNADDPI